MRKILPRDPVYCVYWCPSKTFQSMFVLPTFVLLPRNLWKWESLLLGIYKIMSYITLNYISHTVIWEGFQKSERIWKKTSVVRLFKVTPIGHQWSILCKSSLLIFPDGKSSVSGLAHLESYLVISLACSLKENSLLPHLRPHSSIHIPSSWPLPDYITSTHHVCFLREYGLLEGRAICYTSFLPGTWHHSWHTASIWYQ